MHDVAVALDGHQLVDRARCRTAPPGPTSLRARSTSMTCSATLLGVLGQLGRQTAVVLVGVGPAARDPAMGREVTTPSRSRTMGSGEEPTTRHLGEAEEVQVRARVDQAQRPVDVEGVGAEVEVEALGQHHLEDVAGHDVLLGHLHGVRGTARGAWCGGARPAARRAAVRGSDRAGSAERAGSSRRPARSRRRRRPS